MEHQPPKPPSLGHCRAQPPDTQPPHHRLGGTWLGPAQGPAQGATPRVDEAMATLEGSSPINHVQAVPNSSAQQETALRQGRHGGLTPRTCCPLPSQLLRKLAAWAHSPEAPPRIPQASALRANGPSLPSLPHLLPHCCPSGQPQRDCLLPTRYRVAKCQESPKAGLKPPQHILAVCPRARAPISSCLSFLPVRPEQEQRLRCRVGLS